MADSSYIYVIGTRSAAPVKIGFSNNPASRLSDIRSGSGCKMPQGVDLSALEILYQCEGDRQLERALHHRFRSLRVVGEWFNLHPAVAPREVRMAASEMPWLSVPERAQCPEVRPAEVRQSAPVVQHTHPTDEMVQAAQHHRRMFKAWIEAGFTEPQAISLLAQVVRTHGE